jgi:hypothetical protein
MCEGRFNTNMGHGLWSTVGPIHQCETPWSGLRVSRQTSPTATLTMEETDCDDHIARCDPQQCCITTLLGRYGISISAIDWMRRTSSR